MENCSETECWLNKIDQNIVNSRISHGEQNKEKKVK